MKRRNPNICIVLVVLLSTISQLTFAQPELELFKNLKGQWKFSVGDDMLWAQPNFDDSDWDAIYVPGMWENKGYKEYNGYAWYRKTFKLPKLPINHHYVLVLGKVDDADEVFVNGKKVGQTGRFFPNYKSAFNKKRIYKLNDSILNSDGTNTIAVRVYDSHGPGGIMRAPVGIFINTVEELMEINLAGSWHFALSEPHDNINPDVNALDWNPIKVPGSWESRGYKGYNGYGLYTKKFIIPKHVADENLVLVLGRIDDYDYTYFNGQLIGKVFDLKGEGDYRRKGDEYLAFRAYKIPKELIKPNKRNNILVKVYDYYNLGGIYRGPVGIMTEENYEIYKEKFLKRTVYYIGDMKITID
ncbi:MAG: beta galactosidase jelly roll domain-containing protein [Bacteroidales bacterium]|nr:beta galactosidase jelly roll domain-containing protein [Bacteroidales bacterium]